MSDINKTTHTGVASTNPTFSLLNKKTPFTVFTLKVREHWKDSFGKLQFRDNYIKVETVGKNAHWVEDNVVIGNKYIVDGFLRHDVINGASEVKIRSFRIDFLHQDDFQEGLKEALQKSITILKNSETLELAQDRLEGLLQDL